MDEIGITINSAVAYKFLVDAHGSNGALVGSIQDICVNGRFFSLTVFVDEKIIDRHGLLVEKKEVVKNSEKVSRFEIMDFDE